MYELKNLGRYLRVNLLGPGPRLKESIYRAAVSQRLRNTAVEIRYLLVIANSRSTYRSLLCGKRVEFVVLI